MSVRSTEYIRELISNHPPVPFTYNDELREFIIGGQPVPLSQYDGSKIPSQKPIGMEEASQLIDHTPLAINTLGNHVQFPRMYNWLVGLEPNRWAAIAEDVTETMMDAYEKVSDTDFRNVLKKGTHWGFGASLYRPGHPVFNVLGDCACYGVSPYGIFGESVWDEGLAEYSLHNIDWQAQVVALHAGAGALAHICQLETE